MRGRDVIKRERQTAEAWMGRIRCSSCGDVMNVNPELVSAFSDDLAAYDERYYSDPEQVRDGRGLLAYVAYDPPGHWGEHNARADEAEERARKLAENPPPKRRMC